MATAATLTRGVSFRRQGSSGLSWADQYWVISEEGMTVMRKSQEGTAVEVANKGKVVGGGGGGCDGSGADGQLQRSRSLNNDEYSRKAKSRVVRWLKKAFSAQSESYRSPALQLIPPPGSSYSEHVPVRTDG